MAKFKENELDANLSEINKASSILLEFDEGIEGSLVLEHALVHYDREKGYIYIDSPKCKFKINTALVYSYEKETHGIVISLDSLSLTILGVK